MNCESCGSTISSKMKGAIRTNTCPYCAGEIMPKMKAEQYINLLDVLEATTFTTKVEVDVQIREKVASLLVENFVFKKLDNSEKQPDLIKIDDEVASIEAPKAKLEPKIEKPSLVEEEIRPTPIKKEMPLMNELADKTPARTLKGNKKTNYKQEPPKELTMKDFLKGGESDNFDDEDGLDPLEGLTPEEVKRFFPSLSTDEIVGIASAETKGTGKGIKRL